MPNSSVPFPNLQFLIVPGWRDSPSAHWQTLWQQHLPGAVRVRQRDWDNPVLSEWAEGVAAAVQAASRPCFLVAHSLGVLAVAEAAASLALLQDKVAGAFLVTPPDLEVPEDCPEALRRCATVPQAFLPFPTLVVGSLNDPYARTARVEFFARRWGAEFQTAGRAGHINVESGHGPWVQGELMLADFIFRLNRRRKQAR